MFSCICPVTAELKQSVGERAPLSLQSVMERVVRVIQYGYHFLQCPPLHHLFLIVLFAVNDGSGLPHQFSESVGVSGSNAAPPADYTPIPGEIRVGPPHVSRGHVCRV